MRYKFLLLLFTFKVTHALVFGINNTNKKMQIKVPKIIAPPQISPNGSKDNDTDINVKNISPVPTRPPIAFMIDFVF